MSTVNRQNNHSLPINDRFIRDRDRFTKINLIAALVGVATIAVFLYFRSLCAFLLLAPIAYAAYETFTLSNNILHMLENPAQIMAGRTAGVEPSAFLIQRSTENAPIWRRALTATFLRQ